MTAGGARPTPAAVLAVGGSAGSLTPLLRLVRSLPADLPAAVLVTTHLGEASQSRLPDLLGRRSALRAGWARDGDPLEAGRIYVAPPGFHLLVAGDRVALSTGPRVNRHRPSVDATFASVATATDLAGVVVVLSGALDDGAVGAALVAAAGGFVLVQDPETAEFPGMPSAALRAVPDATLSSEDGLPEDVEKAVARALDAPATAHPTPDPPLPGSSEDTTAMAHDLDIGYLADAESRLTRMVCPECGGALAQVDLAKISYFRCHVGHQYGPQSLAAAQAETSETKIWAAVAALEEEAALQRYLHQTTAHANDEHERLAEQIGRRANQLRELAKAWTPLDQNAAG